MGLEGWQSATSAIPLVPAERRATQLTPHTYTGEEGMFVPPATWHDGYANGSLLLSSYLTWNDTKFPTVRSFFDDFRTTRPRLTVEAPLLNSYASTNTHDAFYAEKTGDTGPACYNQVTGALTTSTIADCEGNAWVAPACRADPTRCIPVYTTSTWGAAEFRQWAAWYDMPIALIDTTWGGYVEAPKKARVPFYWWYPDTTFDGGIKIQFPEHNPSDFKDHVLKSAMQTTTLQKFVWQHIGAADNGGGAKIEYLLQRVAVYKSEIDIAMIRMAAGDSVRDIACSFVQDYEARWREWIDVSCGVGEGLLNGTCVPCEGGSYSRYDAPTKNRFCTPCVAGTYCTVGATVPVPCDPGHRCGDNSARPQPCDPGFEQPRAGQDHCLPCRDGFANSAAGAERCSPCPLGYVAQQAEDGSGATQCEACPVSSFAPELNSSACTPCSGGRETRLLAARGADECVCAPGSYALRGEPNCVPCVEGLDCAEYGAAPRLHVGYTSLTVESDSTASVSGQGSVVLFSEPVLYRCKHKSACSGGAIARAPEDPARFRCAERRTGIACGQCKPGTYELVGDGADTCADCKPPDVAPFIVACFLLLNVLVVVHLLTNRSTARVSTSLLFVVSILTVTLTALQDYMIFSSIKVDWDSPIKEILHGMGLMAFNLEVLRFACVVGDVDKAVSFTVRVFVIPVVIIWLLLAHAILKQWQVYKLKSSVQVKDTSVGSSEVVFKMHHLRNTIGLIFMSFYISVAYVTLTPFRCYPHPEETGKSSLVAYPSVLCGEGSHSAMVAVAVLGTLAFPLAFMTYVLVATRSYEQKVKE